MNDTPETKSESHIWVKDIKEDETVADQYLVKSKRMGLTKKGDPYLSITLADRSGEVEARVWERVDEFSPQFREGDILNVEGRGSSYRNQVQLILSDLKVSIDGFDSSLFLENTQKDVKGMMGALRTCLKEIQNSHLRALVDLFLSDHDFMALFKKAPAAKNFHHNYLGGLLEHTLSVCQMSRLAAQHYPELDGDILLAGAFLHDIGKIKEFTYDTIIDYTDEGRLLGHMPLALDMIEVKLSGLKGFPDALALRLKHLVLSHHGQHEFGSPKRPKFLEAFALHLIDDLDAKMNGLSRFMERDQQEGAWTDFNRLFERYFFKRDPEKENQNSDRAFPEDERQSVLFPR